MVRVGSPGARAGLSRAPVPDPSSLAFYAVPARQLARRLLGQTLVHEPLGGVRLAARIVEVEAYEGPTDGACHARFGPTPRTRSLFGPPGHAYVYLIYGMHECFNVTALAEGAGHAVLIRGVEPLFPCDARTDGPGRLTRVLGVDRSLDGVSVREGVLRIESGPGLRAPVERTARVGVGYAGADADRAWRFFERGNPHVSRPSKSQLGQRKAADATTTTSTGTPAATVRRAPRRTQ